MDKFLDITDLVGIIMNICKVIYKMDQNAKANKDLCQQITKRVKALEEQVHTIKRRRPDRISSTVYKSLKDLSISLDSAEALMRKFSQTNTVMSFLKSSSLKDKFNKMDKRLSDNLQVLYGALQIEHGDVLYKVYDTVSGKRSARTRPAIPTPPPSIVSSISAPISTASMPVSCAFPPMPVSNYMTPMYLPGTTSSVRFSNTIISTPGMMSPIIFSSPMFPMTFSAQTSSAVMSYVLNNF